MQKLRIQDYLVDVVETEGASISASVQCSCGSRNFDVYHTGRQTRGILAPHLIRKEKQLAVKAICADCGNGMVLYDSVTDGARPVVSAADRSYEKLTLKSRENSWQITVKYNYMPEKMKIADKYSNDFENCFLDISHGGKSYSLMEE